MTTRGLLRNGANGRFLESLRDYLAIARRAKGCLSFECCPSAVEEGVVEMVACWDSPLAAVRHLAAPHARAFHAVQAECLVAPPELIGMRLSA